MNALKACVVCGHTLCPICGQCRRCYPDHWKIRADNGYSVKLESE